MNELERKDKMLLELSNKIDELEKEKEILEFKLRNSKKEYISIYKVAVASIVFFMCSSYLLTIMKPM